MITAWFIKDPDATEDYTLNWSDWLDPLDRIVDLTIIATAGITVDSSSYTDTTSTVWLSGGTLNSDYSIISRIETAGGRIEDKEIKILVRENTELDDLIFELRLHLGDMDPATYRYLDKWLQLALLSAIKKLQRWWNFKYLVDMTTKEIYRNPGGLFVLPEPPIIEDSDRYIIVLAASIIVKNGSLQNSAWNTGSWRDAEIAYSNIEGAKSLRESIKADWEELKSLIKPPQKRLARALKGSLPGYLGNQYERDIDDLG